jgi:HAD superfamily phosphatase (TIGR01668 family)
MLKPNLITNNITEVSVEYLEKNNIKALLLDVDNTLSPAHGVKKLREGGAEWLSCMRENGIELIILSNAKKERARRFGDSVGIEVIGLSMKPLPFGYFRAAKKLGIKRKNIAMIGDQYFTDILGGKLAGVKTVMVTEITPEDAVFFKLKRKAEKIMLKRWSK